MAVERKMIAPWTAFAICSVLVVLRFYVRIFVNRQGARLSDYFVALALAAHFVNCVLLLVLLELDTVIIDYLRTGSKDAVITYAMRLGYVTQLLSWLSFWAIKFSFLSLYYDIRRFFQRPGLLPLFYFTTIWTILSFLIVLLTWFLFCRLTPISSAPRCDPSLEVTPQAIGMAFNVSSDLLILLFAVVVVRSLQMSTRESCASCVVMGIGAISVLAATVKPVAVFVIAHREGWKESGELVTNLAAVETGCAIAAACLPMLRVLVFRRNEYRKSPTTEMSTTLASAHRVRPHDAAGPVESKAVDGEGRWGGSQGDGRWGSECTMVERV